MSAERLTVCILLYGDYPDLVDRVLGPLIRFPGKFQLRLGFNNISIRSDCVVQEHSAHLRAAANISHSTFRGQSPYYKYPLMGYMFHGPQPLDTDYVMWFDDDSFIRPTASDTWFDDIIEFMDTNQADMIGKIYKGFRVPAGRGLHGNQCQWIEDQPWYGGRPVQPGHQPRFCTGGWWTIRSEIITRWAWPPMGQWHNGGDYMLGELFRQQDLNMRNYDHHIAINADARGRESRAARRGDAYVPLGVDYQRTSG